MVFHSDLRTRSNAPKSIRIGAKISRNGSPNRKNPKFWRSFPRVGSSFPLLDCVEKNTKSPIASEIMPAKIFCISGEKVDMCVCFDFFVFFRVAISRFYTKAPKMQKDLINLDFFVFFVNLLALGEMSEWSIVHPWKGCVRKRTGGSNPPLSAT